MAQIQLLIRPTARCSPMLPVRWNEKVSAVRSQLGRSVSHRGKAHGRDRRAGNKYRIVTSPLGRQHEGRKNKHAIARALLEMTCSRWIRHIKAGTTCRCVWTYYVHRQTGGTYYREELVRYRTLTAVVNLTSQS